MKRPLHVVRGCTSCPFSDRGEIWAGYCEIPGRARRRITHASVDSERPSWCPLPVTIDADGAPNV